jgi:hypothetical protein
MVSSQKFLPRSHEAGLDYYTLLTIFFLPVIGLEFTVILLFELLLTASGQLFVKPLIKLFLVALSEYIISQFGFNAI